MMFNHLAHGDIGDPPVKGKNAGGNLDWESIVGTVGSVAGDLYYSKKYDTWMGKNFKIYKQTWGGNGVTGGKNKFGKATSNRIKWGGRALGVWNAFKIQQDYASGEISTGWMLIEQGSNAASTMGGVYRAAWGFGWEIGRSVTNTEWYQEAKFNYWYNYTESQIGQPSQSNEELWNNFFKNYEP